MRLTSSRIAHALVLAGTVLSATGPGLAQGGPGPASALPEPPPIQSDDARLLPVLGAHGDHHGQVTDLEVADIAAYKRFHADVLGAIPQVRSITTYVVMGSPKDERA